jgi:hypothetical protein
MNHSFSFYLASAALASAFFLTAAPARADIELCEALLTETCPNGCYSYKIPSDAELNGTDACWGSVIVVQDDKSAPPIAPSIECKRTGDGYACHAWPKGNQISYSWASDQNASAVTNVTDPNMSFSCAGGVVVVSVSSPMDASSDASITLPACD